MKLEKLRPVVTPIVEKPACAACKAFAPECLVPVGDGEMATCWLCAHHIIEHDTAVEHAHAAECECSPEEVYPARVLAARNRPVVQIVRESDDVEQYRTNLVLEALSLQQRKAYAKMTPEQRDVVFAAYADRTKIRATDS